MKAILKYCFLFCLLIAFQQGNAQFNAKAGTAFTNQYIDGQLQHPVIKPYFGLEMIVLYPSHYGKSFIISEIYYTQKSSQARNSAVKTPLYNVYGLNANYLYRFRRYPHYCLQPTRWLFRPYIKAGIAMELLNPKGNERGKNSFVVLPRFAVGNLMGVIKGKRVELEIGSIPQFYSNRTNAYRVKNINVYITLSFPLER